MIPFNDLLKIGVIFIVSLFIYNNFISPHKEIVETLQKTPIESVKELQYNYNDALRTIEQKNKEIKKLESYFDMENIRKLEERPTKGVVAYSVSTTILLIIIFAFILNSVLKEKDELRSKLSDIEYEIDKLPKKYREKFEVIENG